MRRCANCGAINRDSSFVCGICGLSLTATTGAILKPATLNYESIVPATNGWRAHERALLPSGLGLLAAGVVALFLQGLLGVILLLAGLAVTGHAIDTAGHERIRPRSGTGGRAKEQTQLSLRSAVDADKREIEGPARKPETED